MAVWAIADLHLSFGVPNKQMDVFGPQWSRWTERITEHWKEKISEDDLVLIPGDISWGQSPELALPDLEWIDALPGTKVMIRGNHDYWWTSLSRIQKILPPSIHAIHNNAFSWKGIAVAGTRLWDNPEFNFENYIEMIDNPRQRKLTEKELDTGNEEKIYLRELARLERSLKAMDPAAKKRVVMTHYPPLSATLEDSRASQLLEKYNVDTCVFGHLHSVKSEMPLFGEKNGVRYIFVAGDFIEFKPVLLYP